ncbi:hypothetical protein EJB05_21193, partial [Eragrostis curvula]
MMMCTAAPFALPAGLDGRAALSMCGYVDDYDDAVEMDALLGDINFAVHAHTGLTPDPSALPMPSAEFLALPRRHDNEFEAFLRGVRSVKVAATTGSSAPLAVARDDGPTTPVAELRAPFSYGDDDDCACTGFKTIKTASEKRPEPSEAYDGDIDATFRNMEKDPAERPSADYLWTTQEGQMTMLDRAELVTWMHGFSRFRDLPPGAIHRAVSYVDRFLSAKKKICGDLRLLGAVAAFTAAKYEDCKTSWTRINADTIARDVGCTRREVVDAERDLVAALGYRLSGPTSYTFVEHFTRRDKDGTAVRSLAHHLADMTLLDYRCVPLLPSAVAAAAILVARRIVDSATSCSAPPPPQEELWSEEMIKTTGYATQDLTDITDWVYEMHELTGVWPGCAQMMASCAYCYSLPPR